MKYLNLVFFLVICFCGEAQKEEAKLSKENKKKVLGELKTYKKNPESYVTAKESQRLALQVAEDQVESYKKQQSAHAKLVIELYDSIAKLNEEKQKIIESINALKEDTSEEANMDSNPVESTIEPVKEEKIVVNTTSGQAKIEKPLSKGIEPIKIERSTAKTVEPIKPSPTATKTTTTTTSTTRTSEPNKASPTSTTTTTATKTAEPVKVEKPMASTAAPVKKQVVATSTKVEAKTPNTSSGSITGKTYRLQVGSFSTIDAAAFDGTKNLIAEKVESTGGKRFMIGDFTNEEEARKVIGDLKKLGIKGAFVVNYMNGERINK